MTTQTSFDKDGWLYITLHAETSQEAAQLVRFGLNRTAEAGRIASVHAEENGVLAYIALKTRISCNNGSINSTIPSTK